MKPYSGLYVQCPKCGGETRTQYQRPVGALPVSWAGLIAWIQDQHAEGEDWLLRSCVICGFRWPEACADTGTSQGQS